MIIITLLTLISQFVEKTHENQKNSQNTFRKVKRDDLLRDIYMTCREHENYIYTYTYNSNYEVNMYYIKINCTYLLY